MTDASVLAPPPPTTAPARVRLSLLSLIALITAAVVSGLYLLVKLLAAILPFETEPTTASIVLGILGLLSLIPAAAIVVLGHLGIRDTKEGRKSGRLLAAIALGIGYLHVAMWGNRLIVAAVVTAYNGDWRQFIPNVFWWV